MITTVRRPRRTNFDNENVLQCELINGIYRLDTELLVTWGVRELMKVDALFEQGLN
jgi:hypothetical protein